MLWLSLLAAAAVADPGETRGEAEQKAAQMHARLDADHDGYVTYDEARRTALAMVIPKGSAIDPQAVPDLPVARREFEKADTDHDGRLSLNEELAAADQAFTAADTDRDGRLTADERARYAVNYLNEIRAELAVLPRPPCAPGAACATARH